MSACISRRGEFSGHVFGEGPERFVCQRCSLLDEDAMLAAFADVEAAIERVRNLCNTAAPCPIIPGCERHRQVVVSDVLRALDGAP